MISATSRVNFTSKLSSYEGKIKHGRLHNFYNLIEMSLLILKESQEFTWHENLQGIHPKGH